MAGWWVVGYQGLNILLIFMTITAFSLESDKETTDIKAIFYGAYLSLTFSPKIPQSAPKTENISWD